MTKYADLKTKKARMAHIREMVGSHDGWALRALAVIYARQTADEQASGDTRYHNTVGFTGADAEILSSFAQQVEAGRTLSEKQMTLLRKKMPKYARQLMAEADSKAKKEAA